MKEDRRERLPPSKQNCRGERSIKKKTASDASCTWSDDKLYCCFSAVALCCPSVGRGWLERLEGVVSSFCLYFFFFHPVDPVTGARARICVWAARRPPPPPVSLSFSQLEWTRAVHVTSHLERGAGPGFNRSLNFRLNYL